MARGPDVLKLMRQRYPQIAFHIVHSGSAELYPEVLAGELDAAIIPKACYWHELRTELLIVLTSASMTARDAHSILRVEPFIRLGRLRGAGIRPSERFEFASLEAIAALVDRELGLSLVHDGAPPWPEGLRLRKLPIRRSASVRCIGLVWTRASCACG